MFREDGIAAAVVPPEDRTTEELLQAIQSDLEFHTGSTEGGDDQTLLVLRILA